MVGRKEQRDDSLCMYVCSLCMYVCVCMFVCMYVCVCVSRPTLYDVDMHMYGVYPLVSKLVSCVWFPAAF